VEDAAPVSKPAPTLMMMAPTAVVSDAAVGVVVETSWMAMSADALVVSAVSGVLALAVEVDSEVVSVVTSATVLAATLAVVTTSPATVVETTTSSVSSSAVWELLVPASGLPECGWELEPPWDDAWDAEAELMPLDETLALLAPFEPLWDADAELIPVDDTLAPTALLALLEPSWLSSALLFMLDMPCGLVAIATPTAATAMIITLNMSVGGDSA
jgi:hypothetical protein